MKRDRNYRQLCLFLVVLLVPSILIGVQGQVIVRRDREKRLQDAATNAQKDRDSARAAIGKDVWDRLENIKRQQIVGGSTTVPELSFVAWSDGVRLVMPWEEAPGTERFRQAIEEPAFANKISAADRTEFVEKKPDQAATLLRDLIQTTRNADQRVYARLALARVLRNSGEHAEAESIYSDLLSLPSSTVNDDGLSVASMAAKILANTAGREAFERVKQELRSQSLTLTQAYWLRDGVLDAFETSTDGGLQSAARSELERLKSRITALEGAKTDLENNPEVVRLRQEFRLLDVSDRVWQPFGNTLLLSKTPAGAAFAEQVIAVKRTNIFDAVYRSQTAGPPFQLAVGGDSGEYLDERRLPNIRVIFTPVPATPPSGSDLKSFYVPALVFVVGLTLVCGFLLWRDTQRESRITEMRSQFVSSVSHELKTPLTSIRMFAEILQTSGSLDARTHSECVDTIVNESERLTRLLNNVLDFSRIDHGQKSYRMELTRLPDVITDAAKTMQYPMAEQGFNLRMAIDHEVPPVEADQDALKQAVLNLLTNAMKYSGQSRDIEIRLFRTNGNAWIQVADRGIGIPKAEHSRIFERFYRARVSENHAISGTGLGLALVTHIAEAHGGSVEVDSSVGVGSTFSIRLPVQVGGA